MHWADHAISPGKKLWTWGDHAFGHAWDRELTDADGPYVELMAGVFTDNQPDFSFLLPGEVRTFRQYWYPIVGTGPVHEANLDVAVSLERSEAGARVGVAATRDLRGAVVSLSAGGATIEERTVDLAPDRPFLAEIDLPPGTPTTDLRLAVRHDGRELLAYQPAEQVQHEPPAPATEPPPPERIASLEELYLTGLHLQQYRHATRRPEDYYREALRRDPGDSRCNTAMGEWHLRRGELPAAERHLRAALARLTVRNPNPRHGEASYLLGLVLRLRGDLAGADEAFGKAGWDGAFASAADTARAEIARSPRRRARAPWRSWSGPWRPTPRQPAALGLKASLLRRAGQLEAARVHVAAMLASDPLDVRALHEQALLDGDGGPLPGGSQTALDLAHDEARAGLLDEAVDVLHRAVAAGADRGTEPLLHYTLAWLESRRGDEAAAAVHLARAAAARRTTSFPPASRRSPSSSGPSGATATMHGRATTSATSSTTDAATGRPSSCGARLPGWSPASRPCTATWASPSSTCCAGPSAPGPPTGARCARTRRTRVSSTSTTSSASGSATRRRPGCGTSRRAGSSCCSATTWPSSS